MYPFESAVINKMGGCAVYSDAFNAASNFVNGGRKTSDFNNLKNDAFFRVGYDPKLKNWLGRPLLLGGSTFTARGS